MRCFLVMLIALLLPLPSALAEPSNPVDSPIYLAARSSYLNLVEHGPATAQTTPSNDQLTAETDPQLQIQKSLSLRDLLQQVANQNQRVLMQKTEWGIKQAEEAKTYAIFEPELIASISLEENSQKNTVEEKLSRQLASTYDERNWDYSVAVKGLAATGAKYNLGYNLRKLSNSVTKSLTDEDSEHQIYLGISLTQPLLKNAGSDTTKAGIHAAEADSEVAFQDYRQQAMQTVNKAALAYWDFFQAQEKLRLRQESLRIADKILHDNRERYRIGKMAEIEVYEAMAGVASRKSLLSEASQQHLAAGNKLRSILAIEASTEQWQIKAAQPQEGGSPLLNSADLMQKAFQLQPDYLATKARLKQADIKISFATNQRLPELDLIASYGLNGLDFDHSNSLEQVKKSDFEAWSVGMEFRLPLLGGIDSRGELNKNQLLKKRHLQALKDIEIKLANNIDTAINNVASAATQLGYAEEIVKIQKKLLDAELAQLHSGKSNSRLVLEKEDDYRNAREVDIKNQIKLQTARVELELTQGTILLNNGIETMESVK